MKTRRFSQYYFKEDSSAFNNTIDPSFFRGDVMLETAQIMGLYFPADDMLSEFYGVWNDAVDRDENPYQDKVFIKQYNRLFKKWSNMLSAKAGKLKSLDFHQAPGVKTILNNFDLFNILTVELFFQLMAGMTIFRKREVEKNRQYAGEPFNIIHNGIRKYYKLERMVISGLDRTKDNTTDFLIINVSPQEFYDTMSNASKINNENNVCFIPNTDVKFIQVSLKAFRGGAQLGRVTTYMKKHAEIEDFKDILKGAIKKENFELNEFDILGTATKVTNKIKDVSKEVWNKIKVLVDKVKDAFSNVVNAMNRAINIRAEKDISDFIKNRPDAKNEGHIISNKETNIIVECVIDSIKGKTLLTEGKPTDMDRALDKLTVRDTNYLLDNIHKRLKDFNRNASRQKHFVFRFQGDEVQKFTEATKPNHYELIKMFNNYVSLYIFNKFLISSARKNKNLLNEILGLQAEMIFGGTVLPLYKVYGAKTTNEISWDKLGTTKSWKSEIEERYNRDFGGAFICAFKGHKVNDPKSDNYYVFRSHFIFEFDRDNLYYTRLRMDNDHSHYSYAIQGEGVDSYEKLVKLYSPSFKFEDVDAKGIK